MDYVMQIGRSFGTWTTCAIPGICTWQSPDHWVGAFMTFGFREKPVSNSRATRSDQTPIRQYLTPSQSSPALSALDCVSHFPAC
jgi:hypothetical protein